MMKSQYRLGVIYLNPQEGYFLADNIRLYLFKSDMAILSSVKMYAILLFILLSSLCPVELMPAQPAHALDRPFNNAANWGGTGLIEIPNARILEDGVIRFGASQASPYRWYTGAMGVLPLLEFSGRLTQITNIPVPSMPGYGTNKDKAFDIKFQIIPESKGLPAVAIGIHDFHGTRLFGAEYLVISRQYYPIDFTLGIGNKRLKGPIDVPGLDEYGLFGGVEIELNDRFHFIAEYNPIEYEIDKPSARGVPEGAKYPVNVGLRARILSGIDLGLSYQRGNTFGIMLHVHAGLGQQILPYHADPPTLVSVDRRPFNIRDQKEMVEEIHEAIHEAGFSDVVVYTDGRDLIAEFENSRYLSNQKAVGRILRILLFYSPSDTARLTVILKKLDMPILKISVMPDQMEKYIWGEISDDIFFERLLKIEITDQVLETQEGEYIRSKKDRTFNCDLSIKPDIDIYWNDPSGFFKSTIGIKPYVTTDLWKGASGYARFSIPFYSNVYSPISETFPPDVVRMDIPKYMGKYYAFDRLLINQAFRISKKTFGRLSLGYFENMYAGVGGEILYYPWEGRMAFGAEGDWLKKRVPETGFELMDFKRYSILANAYYYYQGLDMTFHAQYGRFLGGDTGWMLDISRRYDTGAVAGIYYSFTDTDVFTDEWNRGYHHKGVYLSLPLRMFLTRDSSQMLNYGISPWTRDVAATVSHWQDLFSLAKDIMPARFKAKLGEIKE
jgi:hypothetical protein